MINIMIYRVFADLIVLVHFFWIIFLILGGFWGLKNKLVRVVHISGLLFAFIMGLFDWYCPLTYLEVWLRSRYDPSLGYKGSFIIHYLEKVVYVELPRDIILSLTILLCALNAWLYLRRKPRYRHQS